MNPAPFAGAFDELRENMNNQLPVSLLATLAAVTLLSCSTPSLQVIDSVPPPDVDRPLPLEPYAHRSPNEPPPPDSNLAGGKLCQLGTSCLTMDPRPFEVCLLGTQKRCSEKVREPLLVENPAAAPR